MTFLRHINLVEHLSFNESRLNICASVEFILTRGYKLAICFLYEESPGWIVLKVFYVFYIVLFSRHLDSTDKALVGKKLNLIGCFVISIQMLCIN